MADTTEKTPRQKAQLWLLNNIGPLPDELREGLRRRKLRTEDPEFTISALNADTPEPLVIEGDAEVARLLNLGLQSFLTGLGLGGGCMCRRVNKLNPDHPSYGAAATLSGSHYTHILVTLTSAR